MDTQKVNGIAPKENESHRRLPSYSVETPYGFHLDLDFVKYVEDIEKGNTIRRVQLQRRPRGRSSGSLSRNLSLPGYSCRSSQWSSSGIIFPRTRLADSQQLCDFQCGNGESVSLSRRFESSYKSSRAFDEQPLGPHVRPNLLRASSLPLTVLLRKYSAEDPTSPNDSRDFLSQENSSSEDVFHCPGGMNETIQQLTAALQRVGELEEEIRIIPELKAQISILQEERESLLHMFSPEPANTMILEAPGRVEKNNEVNDDWMDREYDQLEENIKASSEQVHAIALTTEKDSQACKGDEDKSLFEALQKKISVLEQKLHKLASELEKTTNLLKEQEVESRLKDEKINELSKQHVENIWVRADNMNTPDRQNKSAPSVQMYSPESEQSKTSQAGSEEGFCATQEPGASQTDMEHHVKKVKQLLQEQWECLSRTNKSGKEASSEHLHPHVCSIQRELVSLVNLLTLYTSPAPPAEESMSEKKASEGKAWESSTEEHGQDRFVLSECFQLEECVVERINQNISQTSMPSSETPITGRQEDFRESTELKVSEEHDEEQDRMSETGCPEDQSVEKEDERDDTCSGVESEEVSHCEERGVETNFMKACHFLEEHMDEVSEPNDEMRWALTVVFQQWFYVCAEESSRADTVSLYMKRVGRESPGVLQFLVNMVDDNGNSALHYSVSHSNFSIVKLLLDTGVCDVNLKNKSGYTAVMLASLQPLDTDMEVKVVQQLLELGDVNARAGQVGQTALHLAVRHGRVTMVRLLLAHGANVNAQDQAGTTALISACDRGHADIVQILLQNPNCDVNLTDKGNRSALSLATQASHTEIADLLKARTASNKTSDKCKMA